MRTQKLMTALLTLSMFVGSVLTGSAQTINDETVTAPRYKVVEIGFVNPTDGASQSLGSSPNGIGLGRSLGAIRFSSYAFSWTHETGLVALPNLTGKIAGVSVGANDLGTIAGTCADSSLGAGRRPVIWQSGVVTVLPMPDGQTLGDANDVNASGVIVGSAGNGTEQRGVIYSNGSATMITQTTSNGSRFQTATKINDLGRIIGFGFDPNDVARNVAMVYDLGTATPFDLGALPGRTGATPFDISNNGIIVGSSSVGQSSPTPFIWREATGMIALPLPEGAINGSARGVNSQGWVVGLSSIDAHAAPWLFDGTRTYRLEDLIPSDSGLDLRHSSGAAMAISEDGTIFGTGLLNGQIKAVALVPVVPVTLAGRVISTTGRPIQQAEVTISGGELAQPITVVTDAFGNYHFDGILTTFEYTVSVAAKQFPVYRFDESTKTLAVNGEVTDFDFVANFAPGRP